VAYKTLHQRNGTTLLDHQIPLAVDVLPKNVFFEIPTTFLAHTGNSTMDAQIDAITAGVTAALTNGAKYYGIGKAAGAGGETFANEWAYHQALHDRTTSVTDAEILEYANRQAAVQQVLYDWQQFLMSLAKPVDTKPGDLTPFTDPSTVFQPDPIDWSQGFRAELGLLVSRGVLASGSVLSTTTGLTNVAGASWLAAGGMTAGVQSVTNGLAAGGITNGGILVNGGLVNSGALAALTTPTVTPTLTTMSYTFNPMTRIVQRMQALIIDEWSRYQRGAGGCFDPKNYGCDWSPAAFAARVRGKYTADVETAYDDCMSIAADFTAAAVPASAEADVAPLKTFLDARRAMLRKQFASAPQYPGAPLGKSGLETAASN
jgi:hypothetical protein